MRESDRGLRPRWSGQPGVFEIWFLVVFAPEVRRAWWLRYTTFSPVDAAGGVPRATLWAAAFAADEPGLGMKTMASVVPTAHRPGEPWVRIGDASLSATRATGAAVHGGHRIAWDFAIDAVGGSAVSLPWLLEVLPAPTRVGTAAPEIRCTGWLEVDGRRTRIERAPGLRRHLWGTRRVDELEWLACCAFPGDPTARLEATAVRPRAERGPQLVPIRLATAAGDGPRPGLRAVFGNRVERLSPTRLRFHGTDAHRRVIAEGWCDPRTLVGYVYRDPTGFDVYVAQSDVASCTVEVARRSSRRAPWVVETRLAAEHAAAIEFHGRTPTVGVSYIGWDSAGLHAAAAP